MKVKLLVDGGEMKPGPALSQKIGPLGINISEIISKVNEDTKSFKGMKVPVELDINTADKSFTTQVFSPPVSELIKKELGIEKASGDHKKVVVGNLSIEQAISIAKTKMPNLLSKSLKSAVKDVVGSCVSLGVLIENKSPKEVEHEIDRGNYDTEIQEEKTETSPEKREKLDKFFESRKQRQEKLKKKEEAEKEAEAEKAAAKEEKEKEEVAKAPAKEENKDDKKK